MADARTTLVRGTLDMLVLKVLSLTPMHGLGISRRIRQITDGTFDVPMGSLFPALTRLEQDGWVEASWGESDNNRRAKYYRLTRAGRERLGAERKNWAQAVAAIAKLLETT